MLDSNLLTFFLADATDGTKHHAAFFQTRADSEPEPAYTIRHADPASPASKNCYAAALFDAYAADILYGEVLVQPKWNQPTLNMDEIRRNGGVPPPPEPIMPTEFTIQLYNPDQQIHFTHHTGQLLGSTKWEFSMPQDTFRAPSSSMLDKAQNDPGAAVTTPRINFTWRKEKMTRDILCYVTGKSTDVQGKKKSKEADIAIAIFKGLKEITIYEPNLYRVEMEDPKGLEVTLLLGAAVIKDVFFGNLKHVFNISDGPRRSSDGRAEQSKQSTSPPLANGAGSGASVAYLHARPQSAASGASPGASPNAAPNRTNASPQPPITDPRTQWEIDAETARLKAQYEAEQRERRRQEEMRRRDRERADAEETKRLKKMVEQEEKEARARQKEIDKETERLRRLHGAQPPQPQQQFAPGFPGQGAGPPPMLPQQAPPGPQPYYGYPPQPVHVPVQVPYQQQPPQPGPYQYPQGGNASSSSLNPGRPPPKRKSFLNLNLNR